MVYRGIYKMGCPTNKQTTMTSFRNLLLVLTLFGLISNPSLAQKSNIKAQFSLLPSMSTNGDSAQFYTNNLSFNLFGGVNGGVKGFELGVFANILNEDLEGAQISGITNIVHGQSSALQVAGIYNYCGQEFQGFQIGGIANVADSMLTGLQAGGIFNHAENVYGAQITGVSGKADSLVGIQATGLGGMADHLVGLQVSGIVNMSKSITGMQIAGLVNKTGTLTGVQIGLINISDSVAGGIPIGLLSFSKNGYKAVDISYNEIFPATLSLKTGVDGFYNILSASSNFDEQSHLWAVGYGVGSRFHITKKTLFEFEAIVSQLSENKFEEEVNLLGRFNVNFAVQLGQCAEIYAGPSFNVYASQVYNADTKQYGHAIAPANVFYEEVIYDFNKPTYFQAWVGLQAGIRF